MEELEKDEEIREETGMYVVPKIELDETMLEIKRLALQIRNKKAIMRDESRVNKQNKKPTMPRTTTAKGRERSVTKLRSQMEDLGVDMSGTDNAHFTKTRGRSRSAGPPVKRMRMDTSEGASQSRNRSVSRTPRNEQGVKDVAVRNFYFIFFLFCTQIIFRCELNYRKLRIKQLATRLGNMVLKVKLIGLLVLRSLNICSLVNVALVKLIGDKNELLRLNILCLFLFSF